jgi:hypothetical protein
MNFAINHCLNFKEEDTGMISDIFVRAASEPEFRNQLMKQPSKVRIILYI